jgi:hypothetical protein
MYDNKSKDLSDPLADPIAPEVQVVMGFHCPGRSMPSNRTRRGAARTSEHVEQRANRTPTRGLLILVARLTAREQKIIFPLCRYFAMVEQL